MKDEVGTAAYKTVELDDCKLYCNKGGVDTGFKHNSPHEYRHRLLKVKLIGRTIVIREVPKDYKSLNSGDVFVLDVGTTLYQLNGKNSQGVEKVKAAEFCQAIESDRNGLTNTVVIEMNKFWEALGCEGPIKPASEDTGADISGAQKKLFSDASGTLKFTEEATGTIKISHFDTKDVFVFDEYVKKYNRPVFTPITRIMEGGENDVFTKCLDV
ncbi:8263_t:CDS:2 [Racocetra fulgida]|uniref:8263_t:CDS:1 n=1 Tax=Racocetra fulgida TaxID=60492 RepID=A0A9N9FY24_9GLOM|nr:8263_t:CDS:2 [Racocetra fulgida]